jgi:tetratricopeptide (TPR) repeat protein
MEISFVTAFRMLRRAAGALVAAAAVTLPMTASAEEAKFHHEPFRVSQQELSRVSPAGNYLAARHATTERDSTAAAAFYRAALRTDPRNGELLERAFLSVLSDGEIDEAARLADRIVQIDRGHRMGRLVLGVRAIKQRQFQNARQQLAQSVRGPIADLTATLLTAWSLSGSNESRTAIETIDRLTGPDWYAIFKDLHAGLILDLANNKKEAGKRLERAYKLDANMIRIVEAFASWTSRNVGKDEALKIYQAFDKILPKHPLVAEAMDDLNNGEKLSRMVDSAQGGAAEVLYGLGASLGQQGGEDLALVYLQLAIYLDPDHALALLSLGNLYETLKKPHLAIRAYQRVSADSPLKPNAEIQIATDLDALDKPDEAKTRLEKLIADHPGELEPIVALGNVLRGRKQFKECAEVYGRGVATITKEEKSNWLIYYFRGVCYERAKQWDLSELDLKKALELYPDQPQVLNYLGYSWVDQGVNVDEGMRMIRKAVDQRPDDGYIVDSLGWAFYRLSNYDEAVKQLERAVELKPEDPTINDHLGDAYWRVGRTLEATFQWSHARDLKPEPDDLKKIEEKLKTGLVDETIPSAEAAKKKAGNGG